MSRIFVDRGQGNTSTNLLQRVQARDADAWKRLSAVYSPLVYAWARKAGLQPSDAADVVQEVFLAVAVRIPRFRREQAGQGFRRWLWTICHYKVRDHFLLLRDDPPGRGGTTANVRMAQIWDVTAPADDSQEARTEAGGIVQRVLADIRREINESTWRAFEQTTMEGRAVEDVARELALSRWAVYKAKARVLQRLRQELDGIVDLDRLLNSQESPGV